MHPLGTRTNGRVEIVDPAKHDKGNPLVIKFLSYIWASPNTCVGLLLLLPAVFSGGRVRLVDGVLEVHGAMLRFVLGRCLPLKGGARAMTLGHIVVGVSQQALDQTRPHERVHVAQCERWGPCFLPAYAIASVIAWARGGHAYIDNYFEKQAHMKQ